MVANVLKSAVASTLRFGTGLAVDESIPQRLRLAHLCNVDTEVELLGLVLWVNSFESKAQAIGCGA